MAGDAALGHPAGGHDAPRYPRRVPASADRPPDEPLRTPSADRPVSVRISVRILVAARPDAVVRMSPRA